MKSLQLINTKDGSHSLYNTELNETYHSIHGAIQESRHVFIKNGLDFIVQKQKLKSISILEIGFGTGLNALLSLQYAIANKVEIDYHTVETHSLESSIVRQLNYPIEITFDKSADYFDQFHAADWNQPIRVNSVFNLYKLLGAVQSMPLPQNHFDVIYFDAFAPEKQPDMWSIDVLNKVANALKANRTFVTYCAKGQLRRDLLSLKLKVEKLDGPPGKREMIRAVKQ